MTIPSKFWVTIPDALIQADTPLTSQKFFWIRDNAEYLEEWLGKDYTAATNHNHDGINSSTPSSESAISSLAMIGRMLSSEYSTTSTSFTLVASTRIFIHSKARELVIEAYTKIGIAPHGNYSYFTLVGGTTDTSNTVTEANTTYSLNKWTTAISSSNQGQTCTLNLYMRTNYGAATAYWQIHDGTTPANNYSLAGRILI